MTTSLTENTEDSYVADGVNVQFEVRFKWYHEDDISVSVGSATQPYSVVIDPNATPDNSNDAFRVSYVVFDDPPANGETVTLTQNIQCTQETDYLAFDRFPAESHENALDKLTLLIKKAISSLDARITDNANTVNGVVSTADQNQADISNLSNLIAALDGPGIQQLLNDEFGQTGWSRQQVIATTAPPHPIYDSIDGLVNGVNSVYSVSPLAIRETIRVYYRGMLQTAFVYDEQANNVTLPFNPKPSNGNEIVIYYEQIYTS